MFAFFNDLAPPRDVVANHLAELIGRSAGRRHAVGREEIRDVLALQRLVRRLVQPQHHRRGNAFRPDSPSS